MGDISSIINDTIPPLDIFPVKNHVVKAMAHQIEKIYSIEPIVEPEPPAVLYMGEKVGTIFREYA